MEKSVFNPEYQNKSIESKIVASLERISEAFRVLLWKESKDTSLSPLQVQMLIFLNYHSPEKYRVSFLAEEFNMTKATISDAVRILEEKKYLRKKEDEGDHRSAIIELTDMGKSAASKVSMFADEIKKPIDKLSREQKEVLLNSLFETILKLNKSGIISMQRMCLCCRYLTQENNINYCNLLKKSLTVQDMRIDCPEHIAA